MGHGKMVNELQFRAEIIKEQQDDLVATVKNKHMIEYKMLYESFQQYIPPANSGWPVGGPNWRAQNFELLPSY
jgi:hypothetical protein